MARIFLCLLMCSFALPAVAQNYLYVHSGIGSDSLSGTRGTVIAGTRTGPKATLEGAVKAAPEGTTTAIVLLYGDLTKDESDLVDENGIAGGNDADGITITGDKNILIAIRYPGYIAFNKPLHIDIPTNRQVLIQKDFDSTQPNNVALLEGFVLTSGQFRWNVAVSEIQAIDGVSTIAADGRFYVDSFLQVRGDLIIEAGGLLENYAPIQIEDGIIENAGQMDVHENILHGLTAGGVLPYEQSRIFFRNSATGLINISGAKIDGVGILENDGSIYSKSGTLGYYVLNKGEIELEAGNSLIKELRSSDSTNEGGILTTVPSTNLQSYNFQLGAGSTFIGDGDLTFDACTIGGIFSFQGTLHLDSCTILSSAEINQLANEVWLGEGVSIYAPITEVIPTVRIQAFKTPLYLGNDIQTEILEFRGMVEGPGDLVVLENLNINGASLEGPGNLEVYGNAETEIDGISLQSQFILHEGAYFNVHQNIFQGSGSVTVNDGATLKINNGYASPPADTITIFNEGSLYYSNRGDEDLVMHVINSGDFILGDDNPDTAFDDILSLKGVFTNEAGGRILGTGTLNIEDAQFSNKGIISPGIFESIQADLVIQGDIDLDASSTIEIDILESPNLLTFEGNVTLAGSLQVNFPHEFYPVTDFELPFLQFNQPAGAFDDINIILPDRFGAANANLITTDSTLTLSLTNYNLPPVAVNDTISINEGDTVLVDVLANDFDPYGDSLFISVSPVSSRFRVVDNDTAYPSDDLILYTPRTPDTNGESGFSYTLTDEHGTRATGFVSVDILPVDDEIVLRSTPLTGASVGLPYIFEAILLDNDDTEMTVEATSLPEWLSITQLQYYQFLFSGTPSETDLGPNEVSFIATSASTVDTFSFSIDVLPALNMQPAFQDSISSISPLLEWDDAPGAVAYRVQLAEPVRYSDNPQITDDPALAHQMLLDSTGISASSFRVPAGVLIDQKNYEWRVGLISSDGNITWTGVSEFTLLEAPPLPAPALLLPMDNAENLPFPVEMSWEEIPGSTRYRVSVAADSLFEDVTNVFWTSENKFSLTAEYLKFGEQFYWRVTPQHNLTIGEMSEIRSFTIEPLSFVDEQLNVPPGTPYWANYDLNFRFDPLFVSRDAPSTVLLQSRSFHSQVYDTVDTVLPNIQGTAAWSDIDLDGDPDLILAGVDEQGVLDTRLFLVENGIFTPANIDLPPVREVVEWGRLDLDGDRDLLLSDVDEAGNGITYVVEQTDAGFEVDTTFSIGGLAGWADFDNDGDDDLLIGAGDRSLAGGLEFYRNDLDSLVLLARFDNIWAHAADWADYDNDGFIELALSGRNAENNFTAIFSFVNGTFQKTRDDTGFGGGKDISWHDIENDGDIDLLVLAPKGSPSWLYINSEDQLVSTSLGSTKDLIISKINWMHLDDDNVLDLFLTASDSSKTYLQHRKNLVLTRNGAPAYPRNIRLVNSSSDSATMVWDPIEDDITADNQLRYNVYLYTRPSEERIIAPEALLDNFRPGPSLIPYHTNHGAQPQITVTGLSPDSSYTMLIQSVDLQGIGSAYQEIFNFSISEFPEFQGFAETRGPLGGVGDLDRDGDIDAFKRLYPRTGDQPVTFFTHDSQSFIPTEASLGDYEIQLSDVADYDNDGDLDIIMNTSSNDWKLLINDAGFTPDNAIPFDFGFTPRHLFWEDWDGDNDLDILVANDQIVYLYLFENQEPVAEPIIYDLNLFIRKIYPGDFDSDGDLDFLLSEQEGSFLMENEAGTFIRRYAGIDNTEITSAAWGDYDGDGDMDLTLQTSSQAQIIQFDNEGNLFIKNAVVSGMISSSPILWGDVDNDGDLDLFTHSSIAINDGGMFTHIPGGYAAKELLDVDGDHDLDIFSQFSFRKNQNSVSNLPPTPPEELSVQILEDSTTAVLSWNAGADDTTPVATLSYNVAIGRAPDQYDLVSPMSITSGPKEGFRMRRGPGNAGKRLLYTLKNLEPGTTYYWRVQAIDNSLSGGPFSQEVSFTTSGIKTGIESEQALVYSLSQNYPNPFNPNTTLLYTIPEAVEVEISVYNTLGQRVAQLVNQSLNPGRHEVSWEASGYASGVYFAHMKAGAFSKVVSMVLVK